MLVLCMGSILCGAEERLREKVYITTDKGVYVSGDALWVSAYCMDLNTGKPSGFSKTAYIEIHSSRGLVQTGKIALLDGRGAGRINLLNTIPTGNYSIIAYTAQSRNEKGFDFASDPRVVSIFNTFSTERQSEGVSVSDNVAQSVQTPAAAEGNVSITAEPSAERLSSAPVRITNNGSGKAFFSLSVYHDDGIPSPKDGGISGFLRTVAGASKPEGFSDVTVPEYEGEIIRAHVSGSEDAKAAAKGKFAFISVPGSQRNVYTSKIDDEGNVSFFTTNIYGDNDMFLEIEGMPENKICHLEIESPFVNAAVPQMPELTIDSSWAGKLRERSMGMQITKAFDADTLYEFLPRNDHDVLGDRHIRYILDDYTRFPVMEEVFTEFIPELRLRKVDGKRDIQVRVEDRYGDYFFPSGSALMLIDGVPVLDQEKVVAFDPLLVEYIDIYPYTYYLGIRGFQGIVNFVTYKRNLPTLQFADNVRIVSNQGVSYPQAFSGDGVKDDYPDYRQTICWEPLLSLEPGESIVIDVKTPAYGGHFDISVEGMTSESRPVTAAASLTVR